MASDDIFRVAVRFLSGVPQPPLPWRPLPESFYGTTAAVNFDPANNAGNYTVVATNNSGSATSGVATLTVLTSAATSSASMYTTNQQFKLTVSRETNLNYIIQGSTNLSYSNWVSLVTNTAPFTFTDTNATNYPQRFYRAIYKP